MHSSNLAAVEVVPVLVRVAAKRPDREDVAVRRVRDPAGAIEHARDALLRPVAVWLLLRSPFLLSTAQRGDRVSVACSLSCWVRGDLDTRRRQERR